MNALEAINIGSTFLKEKKIQSHILDSEILLSKTLNHLESKFSKPKSKIK